MLTAAKLAIVEVRAAQDEPLAHTEIQMPGSFVDRVLAVGEPA
jgi:acyl CoA:acetate/3-ketoacid CoA transferase alpha subunit